MAMDVTQFIAGVLDDLERPDLEEIGRSKFNQAIRTAHGIEKFARDLHVVETSVQSTTAGIVQLPLPSSFRQLRELRALQHGLDVGLRFVQTTSIHPLRDQWGEQIRQTVRVVGRTMSVMGVPQGIDRFHLEYLRFPVYNFTTNSWTDDFDSFLFEEMEDLIQAILMSMLAEVAQINDVYQTSQTRRAILSRQALEIFVAETLGEP